MSMRWVGNLLALLAVVAVAFAAQAAWAGTAQIAKVEWGFRGNIASGRWAPVRVWINSGDMPEKGLVTIEYQQDTTQKARIITPVSVMPGTPVPVDILVNLPADPDPITVTYSSDRVRGDTVEFSPSPAGNQQQGPEIYGGSRQLVLCLGTDAPLAALSEPGVVKRRPTLGQSEFFDHHNVTGDDLRELRWHQTAGVVAQASDLPTDPHAFDGVAAIIVDAEKAGLPGTALKSAISAWVAAGGRLVLIADRDGDSWRSWMPDADAMPISLGTAHELPSPEDLRKAARSGSVSELTARGSSDGSRNVFGGGQLVRSLRAFEAAVRSEVRGRPISLVDDAARRGWAGRLAMGKGEFLAAEGPIGLGMVTVIGINPSSVSSDLKPEALRAAWRFMLTPVLNRYLDRPISLQSMGQDALADVMDKVAGLPEVGRGMLYATVAGLFLFAMVLGVGDYFLLGHYRMRQRSWLTAIGWIGLFSLAAMVIIPRVRAGRTSVDRAVCIDIIQSGNSPTASARAWSSGVSGVFAGTLMAVEQSDTVAPGLLRGASAERDDWGYQAWRRNEQQRVGLLPVETVQVAMPGGDRASFLPPGSSLSQASWTYRILADESRPQTKVRVVVKSVDQLTAEVEVHGVAPGVSIGEAAMEAKGVVYSFRSPAQPAIAGTDGVIALKLLATSGAELRLAPMQIERFGGFAPPPGAMINLPNAPVPGVSSAPAGATKVGPAATPTLLDAAVDREAAFRARAAGGEAVFIADLVANSTGAADSGIGEWMLRVRNDKAAGLNVLATIRVAVPMAEATR